MNFKNGVSRRRFVGGLAVAVGYAGLASRGELWAQNGGRGMGRMRMSGDDYDSMAKLANNENPFGPPESAMKAMTEAYKYANRYGYPDPGIAQAIASHHGVGTDNVLVTAGSTEVLEVAADAFLPDHKKVVGVEPTFSTVYQHATGINAGVITMPLHGPDYRQDIPAMVKLAKDNHKEVGFVYLCNPNNPTGVIVNKQEIKQLLDGVPEGMPVLIDEAYHHFVEDPNYATSMPYVLEGRPVVIARTFSKIYGMAGMRLGYAIAPAGLIARMRTHAGSMNVSAVAKYGGAAALKDKVAEDKVRGELLQTRKKTVAELEKLGHATIKSEANFFMVNLRRPVMPVIQEFRQRGVLVGRPFPPMTDYLRVSVGTADEMDRFMAAFKEIMPA